MTGATHHLTSPGDALLRRLQPAALLVFALVVAAPVLAVLASLFGPYGDAIRHVAKTLGAQYTAGTVLLCLSVGLIAGVIGVGAALLTALCEFPFRRFLSFALVLPLAIPAYIAAYAYADLLGPFGAFSGFAAFAAKLGLPAIKSLPGAALILALTLYPYVYLTARAAFASRSSAILQTARTLGASPLKAAITLLLPAARPAIAGGVALIMMETAAEFGVADYFGVATLSVGIFRTWHSFGDLGAASQLASALFLFAVLLVSFEALGRRGRAADAPRVTGGGEVRVALAGWRAGAAGTLCLLPVLFGFIAPAVALAAKIDPSKWAFAYRGLAGAFSNSVAVAAAGAIVALSAAIALSYAGRTTNSAFVRAAIRASTLGYAVPGAVIAIGILAAFSAIGGLTNDHRWMAAGPVALIYAYLVRFLTAGYNTTSGGLAQIDPGLDEAARTLGASAGRILSGLHAPLLQRSILAAATILFVDIAKELPATLILRNFNFETLATRVYRLAGDERLSEAAPDALILIALSALPIFLFTAASERRRAKR
jgi:iron(III) transport system permease protein